MYWWLNYLLQFSSFNYGKSALNFLRAKHFMKTWVWIWHSWKELKSQMESSPRHTSVESKSNVHFTVHWEEKNRKKGGFYFKFGILLPLIFSATVRKKILLIEKNFWNSRLKAENLKMFEIVGKMYSIPFYLGGF